MHGPYLLDGESLNGMRAAYERVGRGLVLVPERRRLFPFMTVLENLGDRRLFAARSAVAMRNAGGGLRAAASAGGAPQPGRGFDERRRAADARDRPGA